MSDSDELIDFDEKLNMLKTIRKVHELNRSLPKIEKKNELISISLEIISHWASDCSEEVVERHIEEQVEYIKKLLEESK